VLFQKGDNNRMNGLMQVHERLRFDKNGKPGMYVFETCKDFIRTVPTLPYSQTKVEDVDTDAEDHSYDSLRYMCMFRPVAAERVKRYHTRIRTPYDEDNDDEEAVYGW